MSNRFFMLAFIPFNSLFFITMRKWLENSEKVPFLYEKCQGDIQLQWHNRQPLTYHDALELMIKFISKLVYLVIDLYKHRFIWIYKYTLKYLSV